MAFIKPIGGEQWFDINIFDNNLNNFENTSFTFLSGGQSALNFIVKSLKIEKGEFILLPAYLCPTIVWNMDRNKVNYAFYKINTDLTVNLEDLSQKIKKYKAKAVFFLNYFGFYHDRKTVDYLSSLKKQNIAVIEDAVQMLWFSEKEFTGDYVFNSYRKFLPVDGSLVISKNTGKFDSVQDKYYEFMNMARMKITAYVKYGLGTVKDFSEFYSKAEEEYGKDTAINGMTDISRELLNKVNVEYIGRVRRSNYAYLYDKLSAYDRIRPLFNKSLLDANIPIGFPLLIEDRDNIKISLRSKAIYCPAHWPILKEKWVNDFPDSIYLGSRILTLPVDQRYGTEDMDRLIDELIKLVYGKN